MIMPKMIETTNTDRRKLYSFVLVALSGIIAFFLMFWITTNGPGVGTDSVTYIETARSLLAGNGFYAYGQPMTHWAPGYPIMLAIAGVFQHGDIVQAARLLSIFFFAVNITLFGIAVFMCTEHSLSAIGCMLSVFLTSASVITTHAMAWSEAPFISFSLVAFILLSLYVNRPRFYLLLAASICVGCAMVIRYAGITLLPPFIFVLLFFGDQPIKHKLRNIFLATTVASLPLVSWLIRNILIAETVSNRTIGFHIIGVDHAKQLIDTVYGFALPIAPNGHSWAKALQLGVAAALFIIYLELLRRKNYISHKANTVHIVLPTICILFFFTYILFLVISISFFDAQTPFTARILLPAFLMITVACISLSWSLSSALNNRAVWYGFIIFVLLVAINNSDRAVAVTADFHRNGNGYTSLLWKNSETIRSVKSLPRDTKIYTNGKDVIQFLVGRTVNVFPQITDPNTLIANMDFENQLQAMCREVGEGEAILVYLEEITWRSYFPSLKELQAKCVMPILARLEDGAIYGRLVK